VNEYSVKVGKLAMELTMKRHEKATSIASKSTNALNKKKLGQSMELAINENLDDDGNLQFYNSRGH
jgi:hypothetical protein